jgi:hypothetical protein
MTAREPAVKQVSRLLAFSVGFLLPCLLPPGGEEEVVLGSVSK